MSRTTYIPKVPLNPLLLSRAHELRHESAPAEQRIWRFLRNRQLGGWKFRRQVPIGSFVADFLCVELSLIIELDGDSHTDAGANVSDKVRTDLLKRDGYSVVRFLNTEGFENLPAVLEAVYAECDRLAAHAPSPRPSPEGRGR